MSDKPSWLILHERAEEARRQYHVDHAAARAMRCKTEDSHGEQCTADYFPEHEHLYAADEDGF